MVLEATARELLQHCPESERLRIQVYHRQDHPQTDFQRTAGNRIAIGLTAHETYWAQYSFQFAHECCHAVINFSPEGKPHTSHARSSSSTTVISSPGNLWLEESLCETASLFTLRAMSRSWQVAPPHPAWREYAPSFSTYAANRMAPARPRSFMRWFRANDPAVRRDGSNRDRNLIVAAQLLPLFEKNPEGWGSLPFLYSTSNRDQPLQQLLANWHSCCPPQLQLFVAKLAKVFTVNVQNSPGGLRSHARRGQ